MKCAHFFAYAFLLTLGIGSTSHAEAGPCNPNTILGKLLGSRDQTSEWLAKHFQYNDVKHFNAELYLKSKDEFENLKVIGQLPDQPPVSEFEKSVAWLDAQTESGEKLPTLNEVLEKGTQTQKVRLAEWVDRYSTRKLTGFQIKQASTELSLILNNTKYSISELYKHGASGLADKMVTSQYHQSLIEKQMLLALQENDLVKKENIFNAINRIRASSPAKWILSGSGNAYSMASARKWRHILIFSLPDHQFAKLSLEDLEILMKTGGVKSPAFAEIAAKYKGIVSFQVFYDTVQDLSIQVSRVMWVDWGIRKFNQYQDRKAKLNAKDHS